MHALFVTTSSDQLAPGHPTGLWLEEFAVPYIAVTEAEITVTVASPKGGAVPLDPKTEPNETQRKNWAAAIQALCHSVTLDSVKESTSTPSSSRVDTGRWWTWRTTLRCTLW